MNERKRSIDPAFLQKWGNVLIYCLLLFVGLLIVFGNLDAVYFGGVRSWWVVLPAYLLLAAENAVKIWGLHAFREKIVCYVLDTVLLVLLILEYLNIRRAIRKERNPFSS